MASIPSLANIAKEAEENKKKFNQVEELSYDLLKRSWDEFCAAKKSKGLSDEFITLSNARLELIEDNKIVLVEYENQDYLNNFNGFKDKFILQLRKKLRNEDLDFKVQYLDRSNEKKKIFTDKDKFEYIAKKYPDIKTLQERMGLDFEY